MNRIKIFALTALLLTAQTAGFRLFAQRTIIETKLDHAAILIGEQTQIHITVSTDNGRNVQVLFPSDTTLRGLEIIRASVPDTAYIENNRMTIKQDLLITSFDSALYAIPPFKVIDGTDTIASKEMLGLKVSTVPVNVDKPEEFFDIATIWAPAFVLADYYIYIFAVLIALFLICVAGYIIQRIRNKKPLLPFMAPPPKLPPHEQAILALEEIKQAKLWQHGQLKEFYTRITDTLRKYIVERFGACAMEMTSAEILAFIKRESEAESVYDNLKLILETADFVKFAKFNPMPDDNELCMMNAFLFVNQTKVVDFIPEDIKEEDIEQRTTND